MAADDRRTVTVPIPGNADAEVLDACGVPCHVSFETTVDEQRNTGDYAFVDGVDSAVGHRDVGVSKDLNLRQPAESTYPFRERAQGARVGAVAETDDEVPVGTLGSRASEVPHEVDIRRESGPEARVDQLFSGAIWQPALQTNY